MSYWTHITGTVVVSPVGRTQHEKRYVLETVLDHLPNVTGSEGDMHIHIIQRSGYDCSSSCDEMMEHTDKGISMFSRLRDNNGWFETQSEYILVLEADLRDRMFDETFRDLQKWLCRLAKRVMVYSVLISVRGYEKSAVINDEEKYNDMYECEYRSGEENWCDYLLWKRAKGSRWPLELLHKYYDDPEIDEEYNSRVEYERG